MTCQNSHADNSPLILMTDLIDIYAQKTFHFLSVSNSPTSILPDTVITLWKSHEIIFVGYFWKTANTCERFFETPHRCHRKDVFFEMFLRRLKDVTKKTSFLRCIWDVLKTSQKSHLFWDVSKEVSEISLSMVIWLRSPTDISCRPGSFLHNLVQILDGMRS